MTVSGLAFFQGSPEPQEHMFPETWTLWWPSVGSHIAALPAGSTVKAGIGVPLFKMRYGSHLSMKEVLRICSHVLKLATTFIAKYVVSNKNEEVGMKSLVDRKVHHHPSKEIRDQIQGDLKGWNKSSSHRGRSQMETLRGKKNSRLLVESCVKERRQGGLQKKKGRRRGNLVSIHMPWVFIVKEKKSHKRSILSVCVVFYFVLYVFFFNLVILCEEDFILSY